MIRESTLAYFREITPDLDPASPADLIVLLLLENARARRGWGQEWDGFDGDIQAGIIERWRGLAGQALGASPRFCSVRDNDGHNYICAAERRQEALDAFEAIEGYYEAGDYSKPAPGVPDGVRRAEAVGGWTFTDPRR